MSAHVLTEMESRKIELRKRIADAEDAHCKHIAGLKDEIRIAEERIQHVLGGLDEEKLLLASHVIYVSGNYSDAGEDRASCREDAISALLSGGGKLWSETFGTKNYDRWHGQRSDHTYGYGPKHGYLIFKIGLMGPIRARDEKSLSPDEVEAAIYYLRNLEKIQAAESSARKAAS